MQSVLWSSLLVLSVTMPAAAQDQRRLYAGGVFGVSTLSADGRSIVTATDAMLSLYKPENGLALNAFAGAHIAEYFSVQGNYLWNRNDVTLVSATAAPARSVFYEQHRRSRQHAFDIDGLIYFRRRDSAVRPYLGTGFEVVRFTSSTIVRSSAAGLAVPGAIASTSVALRSAVGIDVALSRRVRFRYSFSETIGRNPISPVLTPPGERGLANFQNLFGFLYGF
jgi:hypothetical protein